MIEEEQLKAIIQESFERAFPLEREHSESITLFEKLLSAFLDCFCSESNFDALKETGQNLCNENVSTLAEKANFEPKHFETELMFKAMLKLITEGFQLSNEYRKVLFRHRQDAIDFTISYISKNQGAKRNSYHSNAMACIDKYRETYDKLTSNFTYTKLRDVIGDLRWRHPHSDLIEQIPVKDGVNCSGILFRPFFKYFDVPFIGSDNWNELIDQIENIYVKPQNFRGYPTVFTTIIEIEDKHLAAFFDTGYELLVEVVREVADYSYEIDEFDKNNVLVGRGYPITVFCQKSDADSIVLQINDWCMNSTNGSKIVELTVSDALQSITKYYAAGQQGNFSEALKKIDWNTPANRLPKKE